MKNTLLILLLVPAIFYSQKRKKQDVVSNIEVRGLVMKGVGNNTFGKDVGFFAGFGFSGNLMTPINFGIGADYNVLFANVKYGHEAIYGYMGPKANNLDVYLTHRDEISEDFFVEEILGYSYFNIKNQAITNTNEIHTQTSNGINLGARILYTLDRRGYQQFSLTGKAHTFSGNFDKTNYYNKSIFLSLAFGYRYNF